MAGVVPQEAANELDAIMDSARAHYQCKPLCWLCRHYVPQEEIAFSYHGSTHAAWIYQNPVQFRVREWFFEYYRARINFLYSPKILYIDDDFNVYDMQFHGSSLDNIDSIMPITTFRGCTSCYMKLRNFVDASCCVSLNNDDFFPTQ